MPSSDFKKFMINNNASPDRSGKCRRYIVIQKKLQLLLQINNCFSYCNRLSISSGVEFDFVNINRIWTNNTEIKLNSVVKILCCADNSADSHEIIMRRNQETAEILRIPA